jgi:hypothetical protein
MLWKGIPRVKIMFTNARIINGNVHVVQTNANLPETGEIKPYNLLREIGYSVTGTPDSAIELDIKWRTQNTYLSNADPDATLGNLMVVIPQVSAPGDSEGVIPSDIVCTMHVDTSNISLKVPVDPSAMPVWAEPIITSSPRAVTQRY